MESKPKQQVVVVGGGEVFESHVDFLKFLKGVEITIGQQPKDWKQNLQEDLGDEYEVINIPMPNKLNASYAAWSIWFRKYIPHLRDGVTLIGHSLGGLFLMKFLSENTLQYHYGSLFLVAAPYADSDYNLGLFQFSLPELDSSLWFDNDVHIYHSKDDKIVPFGDARMYAKRLLGARMRTYKKQGHFLCEHIPQLIRDIKNIKKHADQR